MRNHNKRPATFDETTLFQYTGAWDAWVTSVYNDNAFKDVEYLCKFKFGSDGAPLQREIFAKLLSERPYLRFYTDQKGAMTTFFEEINYQYENNCLDKALLLSAFCSSINRFKKSVRSEETPKDEKYLKLLDRIDNVEKWLESAKDLAKDDPALLAAYHFKIFDCETAISVLLEYNYLRDAFLCCRLYLPVDHALFRKVLETWTQKLIQDKNHLAACKCFLSVSDYGSAAQVLLDKDDVPCKLNALNIAKFCGREILDEEKLNSLTEVLIVEILADFDYDSLDFVLKCRKSDLKHFRVVCEIHQGLAYILSQNNQSFENCDPCLQIHPGRFTIQDIGSFKETNFIIKVKGLLIENGYDDQAKQTGFFDQIELESAKILEMASQKPGLKNALLSFAIEIARAVLYIQCENVEKSLEILHNLQEKCKESQNVLKAVIENYFPKEPEPVPDEKNSEKQESPSAENEQKCDAQEGIVETDTIKSDVDA